MRKALIVVDVQNDFCSGGALAVPGGDEVIGPINKLVKYFIAEKLPIFFTRDWHPENHSSFKDFGGPWPVHCVAESQGAEFHKNLNVPESAEIISKADNSATDSYSGFESTNLYAKLKELKVEEVVIAGLATDYCVKNTVLDALKLGYRTTIVKECIRAVNLHKDDDENAIREMRMRGARFRTLDEVIG